MSALQSGVNRQNQLKLKKILSQSNKRQLVSNNSPRMLRTLRLDKVSPQLLSQQKASLMSNLSQQCRNSLGAWRNGARTQCDSMQGNYDQTTMKLGL